MIYSVLTSNAVRRDFVNMQFKNALSNITLNSTIVGMISNSCIAINYTYVFLVTVQYPCFQHICI